MPKDPVTRISLADAAQSLRLDDTATAALREIVDTFKDRHAEIVSRPSSPGRVSPLERLAASLYLGEGNAWFDFETFCANAHELKSGAAYELMIQREAYLLFRELEKRIGVAARPGEFDFEWLMRIDTGHTPLTEKLEEIQRTRNFTVESARQLTNKFAGCFCQVPFEFATVANTGEIFVCCPGWLRTPIGNVETHTWDEVWNSDTAVALRESIHDGSYRFCSESTCPHLNGQAGRLMKNEEVTHPAHRAIIDGHVTRMTSNPREITVQYDPTCNLTCPSCRCSVYKAEKDEAQRIQRVHDRVWSEMIHGAERVMISGDGDAFASKLYLKAIREFDPARHPHTRLAFITNGVLLTPEMWQSISNCWPAIESINVSCNAATRETFAINQRGGDFDKLMRNLEHLAEARRRGEFPIFGLGFYVRENNFHEMTEIVALGRRLGVDRIIFGKLQLPGYLVEDVEAFRSMSVHLPEHPQHGAFLEELADPIMRDPIVCLTNLVSLAPTFVPRLESGDETPTRISLRELSGKVGLSPAQLVDLERMLAGFARAYAALMGTPAAGVGMSPVLVLAEQLDYPGQAPHGEQLEELDSFIRAAKPEGGKQTYSQCIRALEDELRQQIKAVLSPEQWYAFSGLSLHSLTEIDEARGLFLARVRGATQGKRPSNAR